MSDEIRRRRAVAQLLHRPRGGVVEAVRHKTGLRAEGQAIVHLVDEVRDEVADIGRFLGLPAALSAASWA